MQYDLQTKIKLPKILDPRGNLTFIEGNNHIPFNIKRIYWIYDVPGGETRGGHAFREQQEFIIALSGSFDVVLDNGKEKTIYPLNRSYYGLYIPNNTWRHLENFSTNSLALVLASTPYQENDYIRDYNEFIQQKEYPESYNKKSNAINSKSNKLKHKPSVYDCSLIEMNRIANRAGNITSLQGSENVPFDISRIFYLYDIPGGESRGAHAHKECHQFLIAASGAFEIALDDGKNKRTVSLNRPYYGLHIPPGIWAAEQGFSSGSICLVLTSHNYSEDDYIRSYDEFLKLEPR